MRAAGIKKIQFFCTTQSVQASHATNLLLQVAVWRPYT